jgi:hypothetical protein
MKPKTSFLCTQLPSTGPCAQSYSSKLHNPPYTFKILLILSFHLRLGILGGLFPFGFPTNPLKFLILSFHLLQDILGGLFPFGFPTNLQQFLILSFHLPQDILGGLFPLFPY